VRLTVPTPDEIDTVPLRPPLKSPAVMVPLIAEMVQYNVPFGKFVALTVKLTDPLSLTELTLGVTVAYGGVEGHESLSRPLYWSNVSYTPTAVAVLVVITFPIIPPFATILNCPHNKVTVTNPIL
jgi:hypothetical protein